MRNIMTNLLAETRKKLADDEKFTSDVRWVGTTDWSCSWQRFEELADFSYYAGHGGLEIKRDLVVVGDGWWLERREYDGSEWWEFKTPPKQPAACAVEQACLKQD